MHQFLNEAVLPEGREGHPVAHRRSLKGSSVGDLQELWWLRFSEGFRESLVQVPSCECFLSAKHLLPALPLCLHPDR